MHFSTAAALLACTAAGQVQAFSNTHPFLLLSTANLPPPPSTAQLQTSAQVLAALRSLLASCPTRRYVLVSQANTRPDDVRDETMPHLGRAVRQAVPVLPSAASTTAQRGDSPGRNLPQTHVWSVAEVVGPVVSGGELARVVARACEEKGKGASDVVVERVELKGLPGGAAGTRERKERTEVLADNDYELGKLLDALDDDYTVMLLAEPSEEKPYEPAFDEPVHGDMKRWMDEQQVGARSKSNSTADRRPLFEKYQFFTPGIFMSFIVLAVILSILAVGLKALASLEVSYGAFDKEMGPAAQKKQM